MWGAGLWLVLAGIIADAAMPGPGQPLSCDAEFVKHAAPRPDVPRDTEKAAEKLALSTFLSINLALNLDFGYLFSFANFAVTVPKKDLHGPSFHRFTLSGALGGFFNSSMKAIELIPRILHNNTDPGLASIYMNRSHAETDPWWTTQDSYKVWHAAARGDDAYAFIQVIGGQRVPRLDVHEYYPVHYVQPIIGNEAAVGFDLGSSAIRLHAIKTAEEKFGTVVSGRIRLTQSAYEQYGFLMFYPLYQDRSDPDWFTTPSRNTTIDADALYPSALVLGVYVVEELLGKAVQSSAFSSQAGSSFLTLVFQKLGYDALDPSQPNKWQFMAGFSSLLDTDNATAMEAFNVDWKENREQDMEIVAHSVFCTSFPIDGVGSEWRIVFAVDFGCQAGEVLIEGGFPGKRLSRCEPCPAGLVCTGQTSKVVMEVEQGLWAILKGPDVSVYKCSPASACPGGTMQDGVAPCFGGRIGFMCSMCPAGQHPTAAGCTECNLPAVATIVITVFLLVVVPMALLKKMWRFRVVTKSPRILTVVMLLGQICTVLQVTQALTRSGLDWGSQFSHLLSSMSSTTDVNIVKFHCIGIYSSAAQFGLRMVLPLVLIALISAIFLVVRIIRPGVLSRDGILNASGTVFLAVFIALGMAAMTPFQCYPHPNGEASVQLHPEVLCDYSAGEHGAMVAVAVLAVLVYLVGTMSVVFFATWRYPVEMLKADIGFVQRFYFLFNRWRPESYWASSALVIRNLCLAVCPMVIAPLTRDVSIVIFHAILLVSFVLTLCCQPWRNKLLNQVDTTIQSVLLVVVMIGSLTVYGNQMNGALSTFLFILMVVGLAGFFAVVAEKVVCVVQKKRRWSAFLSHHKDSTKYMARLFKLYLAKAVAGPIFLDADNVNVAQDRFSDIRESANVILLLTKKTLCQPWCVGEMVIAFACGIPVHPVGIGNGSEGLNGLIDGLQRAKTSTPGGDSLATSSESLSRLYGDFQVLRPYGISMEDIVAAIQKLSDASIRWCDPRDLSTTCTVMGALASQISECPKSTPIIDASELLDAPKKASVLIVADRSDGEALAAQLALKFILQSSMGTPHVAIDAGLSDSSFDDTLCMDGPVVLIWQVTEGSWDSDDQLARLALFHELRPASAAIPVIIGARVFPDGLWYTRVEKAGGTLTVKAVRYLLSNIARPLDLGESSMETVRPLVASLGKHAAELLLADSTDKVLRAV